MGSPRVGSSILDDLGAEVPEQLRAERPGQQLAHLDHPDVAERQLGQANLLGAVSGGVYAPGFRLW